MAIWLIALIVVLSVIVGIPVYVWVGAKPVKYVMAVLCGCAHWLTGSDFLKAYQGVVNDYPWFVALFWPFWLFMAMVLLAAYLTIGWVRLVRYCLK